MQNIMIDLETMGTGPAAAIVAIGAVEFDLVSGELGREFYEAVSLPSSMESGGRVDADTVLWWLRQSDEARALFRAPAHRLYEVLEQLAFFMAEFAGPEVKVWGNGAAFDNVVLAGAFDRAGLDRPWKYSNDRCYRTVKALHPEVPMERTGTHHNALDDAISQAKHLIVMIGPK
jgi:exodeoxyribonuclease VIII